MIRLISGDLSFIAHLDRGKEDNTVEFAIYLVTNYDENNNPVEFVGEPEIKKEEDLTTDDSIISGAFKRDLSMEVEFTERVLSLYGWRELQAVTDFLKLISEELEKGLIVGFIVSK